MEDYVQLDSNVSLRIRDGCIIYQEEVYAMAVPAELVLSMDIARSEIHIFSDSQAALKALTENVYEIQDPGKLLEVTDVPGLKDKEVNESADVLAKSGVSFHLVSVKSLECKQRL